MKKMLEVIASSYADAMAAADGGADRIELVAALSEGGLTPSLGLFCHINQNVNIDVAVMVRPHSNSFCYDSETYATMRYDLVMLAAAGVKHVVIGALNTDGTVATADLRELTKGIDMHYTFHRAIDDTPDLLTALEEIATIPNFTHVLTSGGAGKAVDHLPLIRQMIEQTSLRIVVGSGVTPANISEIQAELDKAKKPYDLHLGTALRKPTTTAGDVMVELVKCARDLVD